jgi:hypothetical protein
MKRLLLLGLIALNAVLLTVLIERAVVRRADAQVIGGGANYLVLTGEVGGDYDAVYILDLGTRQLAVFRYDKQNNNLVGVTKRDLLRDFNRRQGGGI